MPRGGVKSLAGPGLGQTLVICRVDCVIITGASSLRRRPLPRCQGIALSDLSCNMEVNHSFVPAVATGSVVVLIFIPLVVPYMALARRTFLFTTLTYRHLHPNLQGLG